MVDFMDDKQLLGELKRGNNAAFEFLFKSYYPRLRGYAIRFIEDEETVRDIIQECFLRFWERREMLSAFSLTSLLFSMVRNGCLNYLKHRSIVGKVPGGVPGKGGWGRKTLLCRLYAGCRT